MQGRTGCGNLARLMSPVRADDIWRRGWDWLARFASSPLTCSFAAALVEQGSHPQPHSASKTTKAPMGPFCFTGGEGGIRTHGTGDRTPDFESGPFDHSGTSPCNPYCLTGRLAAPAHLI